ncbi:MAG: hypothetical protein QXS54_07645 [Candidatus Methanomethylicaceae archaeon]
MSQIACFPIVGDVDVDFEVYILEDGRLVYAIVVDGTPILGFDRYGAEDLIEAIAECRYELERQDMRDDMS